MPPWLSIVGLSERGLDAVPAEARRLIDEAEVLIGGDRHLAMVPDDGRERLTWPTPLTALIDDIVERRGQRICVLATGDPMNYGIGVTLAKRIPAGEMIVVPAPSAFSLACARLGWDRNRVHTVTLHGRPLATINRYLYPGARLLALSNDGETPAQVARLLAESGYGSSTITVFEHMDGDNERTLTGTAADWPHETVADFNTLAVECRADSTVAGLAWAPGLPDDAYEHDGQLTKREVRAATLAALAPLPGRLLWDVGAGCGSVAIEWMRVHSTCRAMAVERNDARLAMIRRNADALGVPNLTVVDGDAPAALEDLPQPDAVFVGGGLSADGLLPACWDALSEGGRLVANAATLDGERVLLDWHARHGGDLVRLSVERARPIGRFAGWAPFRTVTQLSLVKP
jgi:precorrin-6Y C5,15-methyltransferase (decarboxylating)